MKKGYILKKKTLRAILVLTLGIGPMS